MSKFSHDAADDDDDDAADDDARAMKIPRRFLRKLPSLNEFHFALEVSFSINKYRNR